MIPIIAIRVDKSCFESNHLNEIVRVLRKGKQTITIVFTHLTALLINIENDFKIQGHIETKQSQILEKGENEINSLIEKIGSFIPKV